MVLSSVAAIAGAPEPIRSNRVFGPRRQASLGKSPLGKSLSARQTSAPRVPVAGLCELLRVVEENYDRGGA
jgi:hypothetical protein